MNAKIVLQFMNALGRQDRVKAGGDKMRASCLLWRSGSERRGAKRLKGFIRVSELALRFGCTRVA